MGTTYRTSSFYHTDKQGYIGSVRFYETWPDDVKELHNSMFKRYLYRLTTDIVRTNPQDAQIDADLLGRETLDI